ncbi:MAG: ABC transporter substrate-binding protein, partial [Roseiflexaceae bacterium]
MNRRRFVQLSTSGLGLALTSACGIAPTLRVSRALTVWTTQYIVDDILARWRRLNPAHAITRVPINAVQFTQRLQAAFAGAEPLPDLVVTTSDTIARFSQRGMWYALDELKLPVTQLAPSGVAQCQTADARLLALPLAVNPLGIWYRSDILHHAGLPQQPDTVQAQIGADWQRFAAFGLQIHNNLPDVAWIADALSDLFQPLTRTTIPLSDAARIAFEVRAQFADFAAPRDSGAWFDLLQRDRVAMVIAGSWMQASLARTTRQGEFPWRVITPPSGCIAGESIAIAATEATNQRDVALQLMQDFVFDSESQLMMHESQQLIPALMQTYAAGQFQRMDTFCAGQKVGQLWTQAAQTMTGQPLSARWVQRNTQAIGAVAAALDGDITDVDALSQ